MSDLRILFVLPRMVAGGVERVTLSLIQELQAQGEDCALALRQARGEFLPEARALCYIDELAPHGMHQFVPGLVRCLRSWQPSHVVTAFADVGALTHVAFKVANQRPRWAHGVHNTHAAVTARGGTMGRLRYGLDRLCAAHVYRHADAVIAVSDGVRREVLEQFHCSPAHVHTIYNPVVQDAQLQPRPAPRSDGGGVPHLVALGRLTRQKGFDLLIDAMVAVPGPWHLDIWGEGEERAALQSQIERLGLHERIKLRGHTSEPLAQLRQADLFVLSSRFEGLPTVLIEALACQCPIVAVDCPQGPREILEGGRYGMLVPPDQPHALAAALTAALHDGLPSGPVLLDRARHFSSRAAGQRWHALLTQLA